MIRFNSLDLEKKKALRKRYLEDAGFRALCLILKAQIQCELYTEDELHEAVTTAAWLNTLPKPKAKQ